MRRRMRAASAPPRIAAAHHPYPPPSPLRTPLASPLSPVVRRARSLDSSLDGVQFSSAWLYSSLGGNSSASIDVDPSAALETSLGDGFISASRLDGGLCSASLSVSGLGVGFSSACGDGRGTSSSSAPAVTDGLGGGLFSASRLDFELCSASLGLGLGLGFSSAKLGDGLGTNPSSAPDLTDGLGAGIFSASALTEDGLIVDPAALDSRGSSSASVGEGSPSASLGDGRSSGSSGVNRSSAALNSGANTFPVGGGGLEVDAPHDDAPAAGVTPLDTSSAALGLLNPTAAPNDSSGVDRSAAALNAGATTLPVGDGVVEVDGPLDSDPAAGVTTVDTSSAELHNGGVKLDVDADHVGAASAGPRVEPIAAPIGVGTNPSSAPVLTADGLGAGIFSASALTDDGLIVDPAALDSGLEDGSSSASLGDGSVSVGEGVNRSSASLNSGITTFPVGDGGVEVDARHDAAPAAGVAPLDTSAAALGLVNPSSAPALTVIVDPTTAVPNDGGGGVATALNAGATTLPVGDGVVEVDGPLVATPPAPSSWVSLSLTPTVSRGHGSGQGLPSLDRLQIGSGLQMGNPQNAPPHGVPSRAINLRELEARGAFEDASDDQDDAEVDATRPFVPALSISSRPLIGRRQRVYPINDPESLHSQELDDRERERLRVRRDGWRRLKTLAMVLFVCHICMLGMAVLLEKRIKNEQRLEWAKSTMWAAVMMIYGFYREYLDRRYRVDPRSPWFFATHVIGFFLFKGLEQSELGGHVISLAVAHGVSYFFEFICAVILHFWFRTTGDMGEMDI